MYYDKNVIGCNCLFYTYMLLFNNMVGLKEGKNKEIFLNRGFF